ncbi:reverse transcriptase domain-containing protein [Tanacetum coccineum]
MFSPLRAHPTDCSFLFSGNHLTKKGVTMAEPNEYIFVTRKNILSDDNEGRMVEKSFLELQGTFLVKIRDNTFNEIIGENAFKHIDNFLKVVGPLKIKGLSQDRFRLTVFPISLAGATSEWFKKDCIGSMEADKDDDPNEIADIFKIEGNLFDFKTPLCKAFNEFNYLIKINTDLFTIDIQGIKIYEEYELNKNMTGDLEEPWNYRANNIVNTQDNKKEHHDPSICNIKRFEMMKYSFNADDEYVAIKEHEHSDRSTTNVDECQAYRELLRIMDEGWLVTKAKMQYGVSLGLGYGVVTTCTDLAVTKSSNRFIGKALTWWNTQVQARGRDAANAMAWNDFKALLTTEFCPSNEIEKLEGEFWNHSMVGADHAGYTDRFHELAKLVPHLVTPEAKHVTRYINGLPSQIRGMLRATQPATIQAAILTAGILTDEAVRSGTLAKAGEKRKERDEASKSESVGKDEKKAKGGRGFVVAVPPRRENGNFPKCARCRVTWPETVEHRLGMQSRYEQLGQEIGIELVMSIEDPNVVTSTYSLNNLYATVLFDSGADFSFISTKFAPLLNEKPSIANLGYVIEVTNGKKEEVDRIFRSCRLELGDSIFLIDLIPLGQGSFDEIVGMDWLSNQKAVIMCHEKIVRIPIEVRLVSLMEVILYVVCDL